MTDDSIELKEGISRAKNQISWDKIVEIEYSIEYDTFLSSNGHTRRREKRRLYLKDYRGYCLDVIHFDKLEDSDFNHLHRDISEKAPHIKWIYP